jgi:hypothetical protein
VILALLVALQAATPSPGYDALVAAGLAEARAGRTEDARRTFERAAALDPARPEAWVERAGVDFLEHRYGAAADGLKRALTLRDDAYARELRASALQLDGRTDEALVEWNRLGTPVVGTTTISGLSRTRDRVARREVRATEGALLRADAFRETRLRLREVGVFPRVRLRVLPREQGRADLAVALTERHGLGPWRGLAVSTAADLFRKQVRLRYFDLDGAGIVLRAEYKWERTQPHVAAGIAWPRPLGLPAKLLVSAVRARPTYRLDGGGGLLTLRTRGVDVALRRVVGSRTVVEAGWRRRQRTFDAARPDAPPGSVSALTAAVEHTVVDRARDRLDVTVRAQAAPGALGSDVRYGLATAAVRYERAFTGSDEDAMRTALCVRFLVGRGGDGTPLDAMFAAGAGPDSEYPLRGHDLKDGGVLGGSPIGRGLLLVNVEWRQRLLALHGLQVGLAGLTDVARPSRTVRAEDRLLTDVGIGIRLTAGATTFRVDQGWSVSGDRRSALSAGFGQSF